MSTNTTAAAPHRDRHDEDRLQAQPDGRGRWQRRLVDLYPNDDPDMSERLPLAPPSSPEGSDGDDGDRDKDQDQDRAASELHHDSGQSSAGEDKDEDEDEAEDIDNAHDHAENGPDSGLSSAGSDDDAAVAAPAGPKRAKKGKADRSKWARNNRAKKPPADIGPCKCVNQCAKKDSFRSAKRLKLKEAFVSMDRKNQQTHLASLIDVVRRKNRPKAMSVRRRKARAFESVYHLPGPNGARPRVCKHMLKWVLL